MNEETDSRRVEEEENNLRRNIKKENRGEKERGRKRRREDEQTVSFMYWLSVSQGFCNALHRPTFQGRSWLPVQLFSRSVSASFLLLLCDSFTNL